ncbi:NADH-quinone oxidoreductase subunit J family protein [Desulfotalea psychrophila]|uniref:NADH-quinone oxidoreductase subunit J n=1 Tax=Desulfotalea psychrophila (strain LSv54 / DSM 12343) TaxID=177439 RepID=Q6ANN0_DESPS|nr:NADH-quinone oxidoreductase subunit J [Desulfotalea psychrophila]CAG36044.1 probable NADH dehydrogenase, subunit 6 [Desulfotalea psychrophila LSv54]
MTSSLFSVDNLVGLVFLVTIAITLVGGLITCLAHKLFRALCGFALTSTGVAGLYFFLNSPFISMMQILIYIGAVSITISFGVMLASPDSIKKMQPIKPLAGPIGFAVSGMLAGALMFLVTRADWPIMAKITDGSMRTIGIELLTQYSLVFELISILLLAAILGALAIAREGRSKWKS